MLVKVQLGPVLAGYPISPRISEPVAKSRTTSQLIVVAKPVDWEPSLWRCLWLD
jgi:hypothetical protein